MSAPTPTNQRLPSLAVDRDETERQLNGELAKWRDLAERTISSDDEMTQVDADTRKAWRYTRDLLHKLFTDDRGSNQFGNNLGKMHFGHETLHELVHDHRRVCQFNVRDLESIIERLPLYQVTSRSPSPTETVELSGRVFIIHGHDEMLKAQVALLLTRLGLEPVVLHEQASGGRTVIEKFEAFADVGFAIALLTPDDVGSVRPKGETPLQLRPRARQNVIFELGFFVGKLKRGRVLALSYKDVERFSDYDGVVYVPVDPSGAWQYEIVKELRAVGYSVSADQIK